MINDKLCDFKSIILYFIQATDTIVFLLGSLGILQLLMTMVYALILWRYNSLLPLACLLFTFEYVLRWMNKAVLGKKFPTDEPTPIKNTLNYVFVPLGLVMFWYSLPSEV